MARRPTVLLLMPHLGGGGAERVMALLANGLSNSRYALHLGLIYRDDGRAEHQTPNATVHCLNAQSVRGGAVKLIRLVRLLRPDLVLAGIAHLNFLVLMLRPFFPVVTSILIRQNGHCAASTKYPKSFNRLLYRALYPTADKIICQSTAMKRELAGEIGRHAQIVVLPNPIDVDKMRDAGRIDSRASLTGLLNLIAVGRLVHEKGFDLLLESFAEIRSVYPSARLSILGEGPEVTALMQFSSRLGLADSLSFEGWVPRPEAFFSASSLFVSSSREEGLPNALLEAAAAGLPIFALPSSRGMVELLSHRRGVWLADEISSPALTNTMRSALGSISAGQRFEHSWIEEFRLEKSLVAYEALIDDVLRNRLQ